MSNKLGSIYGSYENSKKIINIDSDITKISGSLDLTDFGLSYDSSYVSINSLKTDYITNKTDGSGVTIGSDLIVDTIKGGSTMIIDPAAHNNNTGKLVIKGDLEVQGDTTSINSTIVELSDNRIKLNAAASTDAGIDISFSDGTSKSFYYSKSDVQWKTDNTSLNIGSGTITAATLSGNAATATQLANARTIGGVLFDGTANIDLPGVNQVGNQNTSGNAATATKLANARTINNISFDGTQNIVIPIPDSLPDQSGNNGKLLITDGSNATWSSDISVNNIDVSGNILTKGIIKFSVTNNVLVSEDPSGIIHRLDTLDNSVNTLDNKFNTLDNSVNTLDNSVNTLDNSVNTLLTSNNDASFNNLDLSGSLTFNNLEIDNTSVNQDLSYNENDSSDNYDYAFVRINKNTGKISRCKYSPGQIIFYSDFCATDNHNVDFSPVRIYIEAKLMMPLASSNASIPGNNDTRTDLTSVLWAGPEFLPNNIITDTSNPIAESKTNKYVKKLIIPPGCPKNLEISFIRYRCGGSMNGNACMLVKRNGLPVYNRDQSTPYSDCAITDVTFYWNDFREGDEIEMFADSHNGGVNNNPPRSIYPPLGRTYTSNGSIPGPRAIAPQYGFFKIRVW